MKVRPRTKHCCCYQGLQENAGMKSQQYSARMGQLAVSRTQCTFFSIYDTPLYGRGCTHGPKFVKHSAVYPKVLFSLESADTMSRKSNITNLFCFTGLLLTEEVSVLPAAGDVHCWWCFTLLPSSGEMLLVHCLLFSVTMKRSRWKSLVWLCVNQATSSWEVSICQSSGLAKIWKYSGISCIAAF